MQSITELEHSYFLLKSGGGDWHECTHWAIERLRENEEGEDEAIAQLAASSERHEALMLTEQVVERYSGYQALDPHLAAGKYLVALRHDYLRSVETVRTLSSKLNGLAERLGRPSWLAVLCRNARHARDNHVYREYFEVEFAYLARLWALASTRAHFEARYNHAISVKHDAL